MEVQYVGLKPVEHDFAHGSGYWLPHEVKEVEEAVALKLAVHTDVWKIKKPTKALTAKVALTEKQMKMRYGHQMAENAMVVPGKEKILDAAGKDQVAKANEEIEEPKHETLPQVANMNRLQAERTARSMFNKSYPARMTEAEIKSDLVMLIRQRDR